MLIILKIRNIFNYYNLIFEDYFLHLKKKGYIIISLLLVLIILLNHLLKNLNPKLLKDLFLVYYSNKELLNFQELMNRVPIFYF